MPAGELETASGWLWLDLTGAWLALVGSGWLLLDLQNHSGKLSQINEFLSFPMKSGSASFDCSGWLRLASLDGSGWLWLALTGSGWLAGCHQATVTKPYAHACLASGDANRLRLLMFLRFLKKVKNPDVRLAQFYSSIFLRACIIYYKYYNT